MHMCSCLLGFGGLAVLNLNPKLTCAVACDVPDASNAGGAVRRACPAEGAVAPADASRGNAAAGAAVGCEPAAAVCCCWRG
jgi:hypothetical protein